MFPFDPSENIRKPLVFCLQGDQKGTLGRKGLNLPVPIPDEERKLIFSHTFLCGASKGFIKAFKAFIKLFEAPQRSMKINI